MLTVQVAGKEIMSGNLRKVYVLGGNDYSVKQFYLGLIQCEYGTKQEFDSVHDVMNLFRSRRLVSTSTSLYVVRYDADFISELDVSLSSKLLSMPLLGTLVLIYQDPKHVEKCGKFFPDNTLIVNEVDRSLIRKRLSKDFLDVPERVVEFCSQHSNSYSEALSICTRLLNLTTEELSTYTQEDLLRTFNTSSEFTESDFKTCFAAKNFKGCVEFLGSYTGDISLLYYTIISALLDLEKLLVKKWGDNPLQKYVSRWTVEDVYNMFMSTYQQLQMSRKLSSWDTYGSLLYLSAMLNYKQIPSTEVLR